MFKYLAIVRELRLRYHDKPPGHPLPQERDLAVEFGVSRETVRQALKHLTTEGLIRSVRGQGTFVCEPQVSLGEHMRSFSEDMRLRGRDPSSRLLHVSDGVPDELVQDALDLEEDERTYLLRRLRLADNRPMCIESVHLPVKFFPGLLDSDFAGSLYEAMSSVGQSSITRIRQQISAVLICEQDRELLQLPEPAPGLLIRRTSHREDDEPVEYAESLYHPDRYDVRTELRR